LSQGVRRLENALQVALFDRGRRGVTLTSAGRDLLPRARSLLEDAASMRRAAERHARAGRTMQVGVVPQIGARAAAGLAGALGEVTGKRVALSTASSVRLIDAVAGDALDLAVVAHPAPLEGVVGGPVVGLPTEVLLPRGHRAAGTGAPVVLRNLDDLDFATVPRSDGPAAHDLLIDTLETRGCTSRVVPIDDAVAQLALIATGTAFALTADPDLVGDDVARRPLAGAAAPLRVRVVHREDLAPDDAVVARVVAALRPGTRARAG